MQWGGAWTMLPFISPTLRLQQYLTGGFALEILRMACRVGGRAAWWSWPLLFATWSELFQPDPSLVGNRVILVKQVELCPSTEVFVLCKYLCVRSHASTLLSDLAETLTWVKLHGYVLIRLSLVKAALLKDSNLRLWTYIYTSRERGLCLCTNQKEQMLIMLRLSVTRILSPPRNDSPEKNSYRALKFPPLKVSS